MVRGSSRAEIARGTEELVAARRPTDAERAEDRPASLGMRVADDEYELIRFLHNSSGCPPDL
jgi:hypothetical protein